MRAARQNERITLSFGAFESQVLLRIISTLIRNYRIKPAELGPKEAAVWYSTRGCESAKMSAEEQRDWLEQLQGFRSAKLDPPQKRGQQLTAPQESPIGDGGPRAEEGKGQPLATVFPR